MTPARFPNGLELRAGIELRVAPGRRLVGVAAPFNSPTRIGGPAPAGFTETIKPGAFTRTLLAPGSDILFCVDHDLGKVLGRTGSGTLRLSETAAGLHFDLDVPDTQLGRDLMVMVERRDCCGVSFGFRPLDESWPAADQRELRAVELVECSAVSAHSAYAATSIQARAEGRAQDAAARQRRAFMETL